MFLAHNLQDIHVAVEGFTSALMTFIHKANYTDSVSEIPGKTNWYPSIYVGKIQRIVDEIKIGSNFSFD